MPLLEFWTSNPTATNKLSIEQIIAAAGDGVLRDDSICSAEVRRYFAEIPVTRLADYIGHCLSSSFPKSGFILQDLVNELGRRLDYKVTNGRYQGVTNAIGFDGLWISPEGHGLVVEVKTTDAYRINLDTFASYREKLKADGKLPESSSILIIVGRQDTGELEAQVRGSRQAWDIRLIGSESLKQLVQLKESSGDADTSKKIRTLLTPLEYTRLDDLVDAIFATASDVEAGATLESEPVDQHSDSDESKSEIDAKYTFQFTDSAIIDQKRASMIDALSKKVGAILIRKGRAFFWDAGHQVRAVATVSKRHERSSAYRYWYAYHPQWDEFLAEGAQSYFVLGGVDLNVAFAIPWEVIHGVRDQLNTTTTNRGTYCHIHISEETPNSFSLQLSKVAKSLSLEGYKLPLI